MRNFKPNLAANVDWELVKYPVYASRKLDGVRAVVLNGRLVSRTLKPIPNNYIRSMLEDSMGRFHGLEGELVVGGDTEYNSFSRTTSAVMSVEGKPEFSFNVFDDIDQAGSLLVLRYHNLVKRSLCWPTNVRLIKQTLCKSQAQVMALYGDAIDSGAEGLVLRDPFAYYKRGRSTAKEGGFSRVVEFATAEATVVGFKEFEHNDNPAETDNLGHTKRSAKQAGKRQGGKLGALVAESESYKQVFEVGSGFTDAERKEIWKHQSVYMGMVFRYKHKPHGQVKLPRHPVFQGWRHVMDI